jgi:serine protease Do
MARNVMTQLIDSGTVRRGMLGVTIQPVTSDIARSLGLAEVRGALVNNVEPGSAAASAGVRRGDVITAVNGEPVKDGNDLRNEVAQLLPGTKATITLLRDGKPQTVTATLAELQARGRTGGPPPTAGEDSTGVGMSVEPLTAARAEQLGVRAKTGVVVAGVQRSSRAAHAGLQAGDVIEEVDRTPVASADALRTALTSGDRPALLLVHRGGTTLFLTLSRK